VKLLSAINGIVAVILFATLTAIVAMQVVTRFVLHIPFIWSEELARFLFFWVVMLGAAMSVRTRRHFVIDFTMGRLEKLGRRGRLIFDIVPDILVLAFSLFLFVQGVDYARAGIFRSAPNSGVNMGMVYAAIPVFAALTVIYSIAGLLQHVAAYVRGAGAERRPPQSAE
jgi:TRAP-type transport system small permease protein